MREYKGIDVLLEAWAGVEGAELWIVGMPRIPLEPLQEAAKRAKAPVRFVPRFVTEPEIPAYFRRADLVVLPYREILWIVGMPRIPLEPLQEAAKRAQAPVRFVPRFVTEAEIPAYFRRADLVALPYREIDQSGVLYTALAFGNALLLTDVGGFGEVAALGAAELVPPGDADALREAMQRLIDDPAAAEELARSAQQAARSHYSWDEVAKRTLGALRGAARALRRRFAACCAALVCLGPPATAAADETLRSGPLSALVRADPWGIELSGPGGVTLRESRAAALGYRDATGWSRALRARELRREGDAVVALVQTSGGGDLRVRISPAGEGGIALEAEPTSAPAGADAFAMGFEAAGSRALLRLRLALRTRWTIAASRWRTTSPTAPTRPRTASTRARSCRRGRTATATTRPTTPFPGCCRAAATACWSTATRRAASASPPRGAGHVGASRWTRPRWRCAFFAGPRPADALRRFTRATGRQPRAAGAVDLRAVVPDGPAEPGRARRGGGDDEGAARRGRAGVRRRDADALPAVRRPPRRPGLQRRAHEGRSTRPGSRTSCTSTRRSAPRTSRCGTRPPTQGLLIREPTGAAAHLSRVRRRQRAGGLHQRAARRSSTSPRPARRPSTSASCARRSTAATTAGWRTSARARRRSGTAADGSTGQRAAQPLPEGLPLRGAAHRRASRPAAGAPPALGLDGRRALRRGRVGRRPHHGVGATTGSSRGSSRRWAWACRG